MKSLRKIVIALILFLTVASSMAAFWISIEFSKSAIQNTLQDDMSSMAKSLASEVRTEVQRNFDVMNQIGNMRMFRDETVPMAQKQMEIDPITAANENIIGINIIDTEGNTQIIGAGMMNFANSPFFTGPISGKSVVMGPSINNVSNVMTMYYGAPVRNSAGKIINTLLIAADGEILCDTCSKISMGKTGYAVIIDRENGNTVGHKNRDDVLNAVNFPQIAAEDESLGDFNAVMQDLMAGNTGGGYYTYEGTKKYISYIPVADTNWSAAVIVEWNEYWAKLKKLQDWIFIAAVGTILLGLVIALYVGRELKPLKNVGDAINEIASGNADLTKRLNEKHAKQEIKYVVDGFNKFVEKLQTIVSAVKTSEANLSNNNQELQNSAENTSSSIMTIIGNINNVSEQIEGQSNSINETASAMNEISANMQSFERIIKTQSDSVEAASAAVEQMVGNISSVNSSVEKMVAAFKDLQSNANTGIQTQEEVNGRLQEIDEQSKMLQDANNAIANIASQTNLLAMNAAIEAAHAGESGKGFSVVADEIRKLSETSTNQSKTIGDELKKIKGSINDVVAASMNAATAFSTVSRSIQSTDQILQQIRGAMEEQQTGSKQIIDALHTMNDTTAEVKTSAKEMDTGNQHIAKEIAELQNAAESMNDAIGQMATGAENITQSGSMLSNITAEVSDSIRQIADEIDQFKV